jgi:hypothetical protein
MLPMINWEFRKRHLFTRLMARGCVAAPPVGRGARVGLKAVVDVAEHLGLHRVSQAALSGIYSMAYYSGLADGLGGRRSFHDRIVTQQGRR